MNKRMDNYSIMIASKYFESIEDYINLEIAVKRFEGNMERFHFNPIPLNDFSRKLFPNLETLHLYDETDQLFNDFNIFKHCIWYYVDYQIYLKEEEKGNDCKYWKNNIDHKGILERKNIINWNEMKQVEEWTNNKIGNIIFDSNIDNWNQNTSVFDQRILNKSNLIFLIEDDDGNKFGGYVNAKIDRMYPRDSSIWINDPRSFVFSLKLNGMLKFNSIQQECAFALFDQSQQGLFAIGYGNDIYIWKENYENKSNCYQYSFNYNGIQNSLCGKTYPHTFKPKRITTIQLF